MLEVYYCKNGVYGTFDVRRAEVCLADLVCEMRQYVDEIAVYDGDKRLY